MRHQFNVFAMLGSHIVGGCEVLGMNDAFITATVSCCSLCCGIILCAVLDANGAQGANRYVNGDPKRMVPCCGAPVVFPRRNNINNRNFSRQLQQRSLISVLHMTSTTSAPSSLVKQRAAPGPVLVVSCVVHYLYVVRGECVFYCVCYVVVLLL